MTALPISTTQNKASYAPAFAKVRELFASGVEQGVFPGAVLLVGKQGEIIFEESIGKLYHPDFGPDTRTSIDTVFDIASLTQPVVTSSLIMMLVENGKLKLKDHVTRYAPGFGVHGKSDILIKHLLDHSAGFPHWHPYFEEIVELSSSSRIGMLASAAAKEHVYQQINRQMVKGKPGTKQVFSDIGYIVLGQIIERLVGAPLHKVAQKMLFHPLGMRSTSFVDLSLFKRGSIEAVPDMVAPTEDCPWRKRVICSEVHDDNAWAMGGVSGHGGCFSAARDLHTFASHLIGAYFGQDSFISQATVREFFFPWVDPEADFTEFDAEVRQSSRLESNRWRYGWEAPHEENGMLGAGLSPFAIGHAGFTGCSLWLEPEAGVDIILLSNRIHPTRNNKKIKEFRPLIHAAIVEALQ